MSFLLVVIPIAHNYILYNRTSIIWASMIILKILPCSKRMLCSFIQTVHIFWTLLFKTLNHKVQVFKCSHSFWIERVFSKVTILIDVHFSSNQQYQKANVVIWCTQLVFSWLLSNICINLVFLYGYELTFIKFLKQ